MQSPSIERKLDRHLLQVEKPGRYVGGEYNSVIKDWAATDIKVALAFPDIYDLGMSNLGIMNLYHQVNLQPNMLAERVFSPWLDMETVMRESDIPLYSLESKQPVRDFDLLGISLPYEQLYTNAINLLDLARMPILSRERDERYPLVIAGGHACYNPEPMADFIDAFVIGEGEEIIVEIAQAIGRLRGSHDSNNCESSPRSKASMYRASTTSNTMTMALSARSYQINPHTHARAEAHRHHFAQAVHQVHRPNIDTVHNRAPIEIMRGCTRGCRFCHAGMVTRPVRERPVKEIMDAIEEIVQHTGFEEISLLSLSSSDYVWVEELAEEVNRVYKDAGLS